jgi:Holliday junction resolvasome RuvABC ATP-dependent DNA helicase subunit
VDILISSLEEKQEKHEHCCFTGPARGADKTNLTKIGSAEQAKKLNLSVWNLACH